MKHAVSGLQRIEPSIFTRIHTPNSIGVERYDPKPITGNFGENSPLFFAQLKKKNTSNLAGQGFFLDQVPTFRIFMTKNKWGNPYGGSLSYIFFSNPR